MTPGDLVSIRYCKGLGLKSESSVFEFYSLGKWLNPWIAIDLSCPCKMDTKLAWQAIFRSHESVYRRR